MKDVNKRVHAVSVWEVGNCPWKIEMFMSPESFDYLDYPAYTNPSKKVNEATSEQTRSY